MSPIAAAKRHGYRKAAEDLRENPGQWKAYESLGHCVMLAGPGSGKTKTLTIKMARMLAEDVSYPRGIACITFNSECVRELSERLDQLGVRESENVFIGTVHSFCLQHLVRPYADLGRIAIPKPIVVASETDQARLFEQALDEVVSASEYPPAWRGRMEEYRRTHLDRDSSDWADDEDLARLINRYEEKLRAARLIDFDDMVIMGLKLVEENEWVRRSIRARFPILVVDEYQDLGVPLHRLVVSVCFGAGIRLLAVGDPDQSIYGFTGARPELLRELSERADVEAVRLRFNYRSGRRIVMASMAALGEIRDYEAQGSYAGTVDIHEISGGLETQAAFVCDTLVPEALKRRRGRSLSDVAVLYVDRNDGDVIAAQAFTRGFKTIRIDRGAAYPKTALTRWLEQCARWCASGWKTGEPRLSSLIRTWLSLQRVRPGEAARRAERALVVFLAAHRDSDIPLVGWLEDFEVAGLRKVLDEDPTSPHERDAYSRLTDACKGDGSLVGMAIGRFSGQTGASDHLNLITLHSAKSLEFDVVIMIGLEEGRLPRYDATSARGLRDARRLFYVGVTRAKHEVHMLFSGWYRNAYGRVFANGPSRFVGEVRERLNEPD
jgi:DNA helicase II / ATP-dependent DNA helicase PcrA